LRNKDNRGNSRANTCTIRPDFGQFRLAREGAHLLEPRPSGQATAAKHGES